METLATLALDVRVPKADEATASLRAMKGAAREVEDQFTRTSAAQRDAAIAQGLSGTAAGNAEKSMRALATVYGQARDSLGRFAKEDGSFRASQEATALMMIRNAQAASALAKQQEQAARVVAKAEADAAREAQAAWKHSQAIQAEIMRERVALARAAEREESQAARAAAKAIADADREAERSAQQVTSFRLRMARQRATEEAAAAREGAQAQAAAAAQVASLSRQYDSLRASLDPFAAVQLRLAQNTKLLDDALAHGAITARQYEDSLSKVTRAATSDLLAIDNLNKGHATAVGGSKNLTYAMLNLSRQASDMGGGFIAAATSGKPLQMVFMTLVQQTPQVVDVFAQMKAEGVGVKTALGQMATAARGLIVTFAPWIAGLAAVGAGVWYLVDAHQKQAKALKDLNKDLQDQNKELAQISPYLTQAGVGAELAADGLRNYDKWLRTSNVSLEQQNKLLRENALRKLNDQAMEAAQKYSEAQKAFDRVNKPGPTMMSAGGAGGFAVVAPAKATDPKANPFYKEAAENLKIAKEAYEAVNKYRNEAYLAPVPAFSDQADAATRTATAVRSVAKEVEQLAGLKPFDEDKLLKASEEIWPYMAAVIQATEKRTRDLNAAAQQLDRTLGDIRIPSDLENLAFEMEEAAGQARGLRFDIEDIGRAIAENDWSTGFAGLLNVLAKVKVALGQNATELQKIQALAGVGMGVGSIVGGKVGAGISGAASGALSGAAFAGSALGTALLPGLGTLAGAGIGAVIGGLGSLFGGGGAKKRARQEEEARRQAEEAQRVQTVADTKRSIEISMLEAQGKTLEAVAARREDELAALLKLDPSLVDLQKQLYAATDAAEAAAKAAEKAAQVEARRSSIQDEIDKLTLSSADLLAKARGKERAEAVALDPALGDLIDKLYGLQDAAAATALQAEEAARAAAEQEAALAAAAETARIQAHVANELTAAYERQAEAMKSLGNGLLDTIYKSYELTKSLKDLANELSGELGMAGQMAGYDAAKSNLIAGAKKGGDIEPLIRTFLEASQNTQSSSAGYQLDVAWARALALQESQRQAGIPAAIARMWQGMLADQKGLPAFANGGSMILGGNPGIDQNILSLNNQPIARVSAGEMATFTPQGGGAANDNGWAAVVAELRTLRQTVASQASDIKKLESYIRNSTDGGEAMKTVNA
ncbi:hypothetical protein [Caulobacter sp. RHG1]|uniref:hypothetical protein n=1 Tax=Caulobacter sp. (strain RHG1) TaxID=2545762 RepID=UPI001556BB38|nr:hypothetical protein [Caulobacter sp. RHG1]NQE62964.1 hypothetical protein [Caulobacter sp. RHG1]